MRDFFTQRKLEMKCEEFESIGLDAERNSSLSDEQRVAAREHAATCSRCAALLDSLETAGMELREFAVDTAMAQAPARVEMRLRQEFRTRHETMKVRRTAVIAASALAAAALLAVAVSWIKWRTDHSASIQSASNPSVSGNPASGRNTVAPKTSPAQTDPTDSDTLMADNELSDFTLLPGTLVADTSDSSILRVRMQRSSLGTLGLPVNEERAGEWIQVDLLVGSDGLPQAVRLPQ